MKEDLGRSSRAQRGQYKREECFDGIMALEILDSGAQEQY
jgi:hypothetical protein